MIDRSKPILKNFESHLIESYTTLTPTKLRELANILEEKEIVHLECSVGGYEGYFVCEERRMETEEEAAQRYKSEVESEKRRKEYRKAEFNRLLKEFGHELS